MKCIAGLLLIGAVCLGSAAAAESLPHIILMMGDDHGWEETGYNGHPYVKTPVLDELARSGVRLDRFYAAHPSCSPTRASFLTGRHPNRMGTFAPGWSLRPEEITLAHLASQAGYRCSHLGKWHVGTVKAGSPCNPGAMGFHEWLSHDNFFEMDPPLSRNGGPPEIFPGESSEVLIREAIRFFDAHKQSGHPLLTVIWFGSPHEPYSGLPADLALYDDLPQKYTKLVSLTSNETGGTTRRPQGEVLRERYAEITAMDRAIGHLRDYLKAQGLRDNTLLFYCGDNGTSPESALGAPHRGAKAQVYEGGILVPGLIEWPARYPTPKTIATRASTSDLLPTIASIINQPLPSRPLDGVNVLPILDSLSTERPNPLYFWEYDTRVLMQSKPQPWIAPEWQRGTTPLVKLMGGIATRNFTNFRQPDLVDSDYLGPRTIIDGDYKFVIHDRPNGDVREELFNLQTDPAEKRNLLDAEPEKAAQLKTQLKAWQSSVLHSLTGADYRQE